MDITIVSGGQTGVDRAGLDFAIEHNLKHGGKCPRGRMAEDGVIPARYQLEEAAERGWSARTKRNVEESDGTLIFAADEPLEGGTKLTADWARQIGKPLLVLLQRDGEAQEQKLRDFIEEHQIKRLNVAGPRASKFARPETSKQPTLRDFVMAVLGRWYALIEEEK